LKIFHSLRQKGRSGC